MDIRYLQRYEVVCDDNLNPEEACDVRTQYSTVFPLPSNQNCPSASMPSLRFTTGLESEAALSKVAEEQLQGGRRGGEVRFLIYSNCVGAPLM
jgi:hypothetical protein